MFPDGQKKKTKNAQIFCYTMLLMSYRYLKSFKMYPITWVVSHVYNKELCEQAYPEGFI